MSLQDKLLQCFDCKSTFIFSAEEQSLFQLKGHNNAPKRCLSCRQARKERQGSVGSRNSIPTYQSQHQMYPTICVRCGKSTQVPFEPREGRPVYCRDCYSLVRVAR